MWVNGVVKKIDGVHRIEEANLFLKNYFDNL